MANLIASVEMYALVVIKMLSIFLTETSKTLSSFLIRKQLFFFRRYEPLEFITNCIIRFIPFKSMKPQLMLYKKLK